MLKSLGSIPAWQTQNEAIVRFQPWDYVSRRYIVRVGIPACVPRGSHFAEEKHKPPCCFHGALICKAGVFQTSRTCRVTAWCGALGESFPSHCSQHSPEGACPTCVSPARNLTQGKPLASVTNDPDESHFRTELCVFLALWPFHRQKTLGLFFSPTIFSRTRFSASESFQFLCDCPLSLTVFSALCVTAKATNYLGFLKVPQFCI